MTATVTRLTPITPKESEKRYRFNQRFGYKTAADAQAVPTRCDWCDTMSRRHTPRAGHIGVLFPGAYSYHWHCFACILRQAIANPEYYERGA